MIARPLGRGTSLRISSELNRSQPKHARPADTGPDGGLAILYLGPDLCAQAEACVTVTPQWQEKWLDDLEAEKRKLTFGPLDAWLTGSGAYSATPPGHEMP